MRVQQYALALSLHEKGLRSGIEDMGSGMPCPAVRMAPHDVYTGSKQHAVTVLFRTCMGGVHRTVGGPLAAVNSLQHT